MYTCIYHILNELSISHAIEIAVKNGHCAHILPQCVTTLNVNFDVCFWGVLCFFTYILVLYTTDFNSDILCGGITNHGQDDATSEWKFSLLLPVFDPVSLSPVAPLVTNVLVVWGWCAERRSWKIIYLWVNTALLHNYIYMVQNIWLGCSQYLLNMSQMLKMAKVGFDSISTYSLANYWEVDRWYVLRLNDYMLINDSLISFW